MKKSLLLLPLLVSLSACNSGGGGSSSKRGPHETDENNPVVIDIDAEIDGAYLAVFTTLNPQITSKITGAATFARDKETDEVIGDVRINSAGPKLIHAQYIRTGKRCPIMDDDINADGVIDAQEGEAVYGKIFFPLDGDLSSQASHDGEFPVGDNYGNYIYSRVAKFSSFMKDLRSKDNADEYVKLKNIEPLVIEGKVVVVHGVDEAMDLPPTVRGWNRRSPYQSLPIVCGLLKKVIDHPGTIETPNTRVDIDESDGPDINL